MNGFENFTINMGHYIQCIIGKDNVINELTNNWIHANKLSLKEEFSLIPMTEELIDDINELANCGSDLAHDEFEMLSKSVELVLKEISHLGKIAYIETEYFGGSGVQSAISYKNGKIQDGPKSTKTEWDNNKHEFRHTPCGVQAINSILLGLGLPEREDKDSFDYLGLGNFRSNEKIIKAYNNG